MNPFEKLYYSTLRFVPYKPKELVIDREEELIKEERTENGMQHEEVKGGFVDLNIPVPSQVKHSHTDYNKIDPVAIYRNKVSLKNEPYDIDKVNILYNRTNPSSQSFTSWINNSQKRASIEGKYYKNFVRWMDNNLRKSLWKEKCATGIQRMALPELNGIKLNNVYRLIDFDYHIIWEYAIFENNEYKILVNAKRKTGDNIPVSISSQVAAYHEAIRGKQGYYRQFIESEFYDSKTFEDIFLHPNEYEVVDRENVSYANCAPSVIHKLFTVNDPRLPQLRKGSKLAYDNYVERIQASQDPGQPEEKKREMEMNV